MRLSTKNKSPETSSSSEGNSDKVECSKCGKLVKSKDKAIQCATCQLIYHAKCQKVSDAKYEALKEDDGDMFWFCLSCRRTTVNLIQTTARIEERVTSLEVAIDQKAEKEDVKELEDKVKKLEKSVSEKFARLEDEENVKTGQIVRKIEEKIEGKIEQQLDREKTDNNKPSASVQEAVDEVKEQERRKSNVVLFNVPESSSADLDARRKYDVEVVEELMKEGILKTAEIKSDGRGIKMVTRLGKREENKVRPLKVTFTSPEGQRLILGNARNLMNAKNEMYRKVVVKPDLTQMQREMEKKLVTEKKRRNQEAAQNQETADWVIYRGRLTRRGSLRTPKTSVGTSMSSLLEEFKDAPQEN